MALHTSSDSELRNIIFAKDRVIVMFNDVECEICKTLLPAFEKFSNNPSFKDITFLHMDAAENPVSSKEVKLTGTPFFATYYKGTLRDCGLLSSEEKVRRLLDTLLGYKD
ncbi:thioredoxin family protein [Rufibacter roseus]|uniref:Thioredoxin family protein n=1 Tax=Rufibacter roseus TaxID=1567108 RepID=A0ABW2DGH5_9BACT|nr:thioredoxin family protein [Rufibacter roseus]